MFSLGTLKTALRKSGLALESSSSDEWFVGIREGQDVSGAIEDLWGHLNEADRVDAIYRMNGGVTDQNSAMCEFLIVNGFDPRKK